MFVQLGAIDMIFLVKGTFSDGVALAVMHTAKSHPQNAQAWQFLPVCAHAWAAALAVVEVGGPAADGAAPVFQAQIQIPPYIIGAVEQQIHAGHLIAQAEVYQVGDIFPGSGDGAAAQGKVLLAALGLKDGLAVCLYLLRQVPRPSGNVIDKGIGFFALLGCNGAAIHQADLHPVHRFSQQLGINVTIRADSQAVAIIVQYFCCCYHAAPPYLLPSQTLSTRPGTSPANRGIPCTGCTASLTRRKGSRCRGYCPCSAPPISFLPQWGQ